MTYSQMPSIGICLPWWFGGFERSGKGCDGWIKIVFNHILLLNLVNIKNGLGGDFLLNPEIDVVPTISCLPELPMGDDIDMEAGDIGNVLKQEEMLAYRRFNVDLDVPIIFHVGTAVSS
jgi:hypothetical protein